MTYQIAREFGVSLDRFIPEEGLGRGVKRCTLSLGLQRLKPLKRHWNGPTCGTPEGVPWRETRVFHTGSEGL